MKIINGTQTKAGAVKWVKRNRPGKNWEVIEADITGPNGKPDGMEEVVVYDGRGNVKIVNGYALAASKFPWRAAYYNRYPTKLDQRRHPFQEFKRLYMKTGTMPNAQGNYEYVQNLPDKYAGVRRVITPMQQFRNVFFTPTYKLFADEIKVKNFDALGKSQLSARIFSFVYKTLLERPAMVTGCSISEENVSTMAEKDYKRYLKDSRTQTTLRNTLNNK